jgi:hypothetical protein
LRALIVGFSPLRRAFLDVGYFLKIETELTIAEEIVTLAVIGSDAVLLDGLAVLLRGIALV